jgi:hypothetical protein
LRAENGALREQVRLLLASQRDLYAQARELRSENDAQRVALADLGRRLHGQQLADTIPMPRVRSHTPDLSTFPPKEWTT